MLNQNRAFAATVGVFTLFLTLSAGCAKKPDATKAGAAQAASLPPPVQVVPARSETMLRLVPVTGSLQALQTVDILPKISARVLSVSGREGDPVRVGQVVAQLDTADLQRQVDQSRANIETIRVRISQARTNYSTQVTTSDVAVRDAQEQLRAAQAQLEVTRRPQRSQEVVVAENSVKQAQANYDKAKSDRVRYAQLFKEGATAAITLDQYVTQEKVAQATLDSAKQQLAIIKQGGRAENIQAQVAQVARARGALRQAQANRANVSVRREDIESAQANLAQAQAQLAVARQAVADASLRSPISGVIATRKIEPGQLAVPSQSIAQVIALDTVYFEAQINEQDVANVRQGQPVQITLDAYPGRSFSGKIARLSPTGSATGRTFSARVEIPNAGGILRPGLFARGAVVTASYPNSVTAPIEALLRSDENTTEARLFTVENGVAHEHKVTTGVESPDGRRYAVRGIEAGAQIVVAGQRSLKDGDKVNLEPVTAAASGGATSGTGGDSGGGSAEGGASGGNGGSSGSGFSGSAASTGVAGSTGSAAGGGTAGGESAR